ncbi:nucleotidyltransferase domain-containing protein [Sorangium sp. So ce362]|uniref:nucleotidyltransferase domain-containing protein n=1 Tax=Sorangium sp. So ce362 TaxID=3133303 RepID=UPI003F5DEDED
MNGANGALDVAARVAARLGAISGVVAVVLGGSRSRGEGHPDSDIDLGIYYEPERPPDLPALRALARELCASGAGDTVTPLARELLATAAGDDVTPLGAWGPWINGGAWLEIEGHRVDWLYRDLARMRRVIEECRAGQVTCDYQPGHPHGFLSSIYLADLHDCRPLFDPGGALAPLKALVTPYPPALRRALLDRFLWEAGFAIDTAKKAARRGDVTYVSGCLFRAAACLVQALFALNERYLSNEKGSLQRTRALPRCPERFADRVEAALSAPGDGAQALLGSLGRMEALAREMSDLCRRDGASC